MGRRHHEYPEIIFVAVDPEATAPVSAALATARRWPGSGIPAYRLRAGADDGPCEPHW